MRARRKLYLSAGKAIEVFENAGDVCGAIVVIATLMIPYRSRPRENIS